MCIPCENLHSSDRQPGTFQVAPSFWPNDLFWLLLLVTSQSGRAKDLSAFSQPAISPLFESLITPPCQNMHFPLCVSSFVLDLCDCLLSTLWPSRFPPCLKISNKLSTHTWTLLPLVYFPGQNWASCSVVKLYSFTFSSAQMRAFLWDCTLQH